MIFNNETELHFSAKFLSITISTNKVVFTAIHTIKVDQLISSKEKPIIMISKHFSFNFPSRVIILVPSDPRYNAAN